MPTPVPGRGEDGGFAGRFEMPMPAPAPAPSGQMRKDERRGMLKPIITSTGPEAVKPGGSVQIVQPALPKIQLPPASEQKPAGTAQSNGQQRNRRMSFIPPPQNTPYSRDMLLRAGSFSQAEALLGGNEAEDEEELEDATMANVEEILEGFDWSAATGTGGGDAIEGRLLDELNALSAVSE